MEISISVKDYYPSQKGGKVLGSCTVTVGAVEIKGVRICLGKNGHIFAGMPSITKTNADGSKVFLKVITLDSLAQKKLDAILKELLAEPTAA